MLACVLAIACRLPTGQATRATCHTRYRIRLSVIWRGVETGTLELDAVGRRHAVSLGSAQDQPHPACRHMAVDPILGRLLEMVGSYRSVYYIHAALRIVSAALAIDVVVPRDREEMPICASSSGGVRGRRGWHLAACPQPCGGWLSPSEAHGAACADSTKQAPLETGNWNHANLRYLDCQMRQQTSLSRHPIRGRPARSGGVDTTDQFDWLLD